MLQADVALARVIRQTARLRPATAAEAADQARALAALTRAQTEVWRELREGLGIRLAPRWAGAIDAQAVQAAAAWLGPVDADQAGQADQADQAGQAGQEAGQ